jgi:hypothetical protein
MMLCNRSNELYACGNSNFGQNLAKIDKTLDYYTDWEILDRCPEPPSGSVEREFWKFLVQISACIPIILT